MPSFSSLLSSPSELHLAADINSPYTIIPCLTLILGGYLYWDKRSSNEKKSSEQSATGEDGEVPVGRNSGSVVSRLFNPQSRRLPLPPGPSSWPIIGYTGGLPNVKAWEVYKKWGQVYGDIIYVPTFHDHIIILNSAEAIFELLERRGNTYSDRPYMVMFHELMNFTTTTAFTGYGARWRKHRKIYNQQMNNIAVKKFQGYQLDAARGLLQWLLDCDTENREQDLGKLCRRFAISIVLNIAYGHQLTGDDDDDFVRYSEGTGKAFAEASQPGYYLVDHFPILKYVPAWFPFATFQKIARETRELLEISRDITFRTVVKAMKEGRAPNCFISESLEALREKDLKNGGDDRKNLDIFDETREDVYIIKSVAGGIYGAGGGTTTSSIFSFILAMVLHPEVQRKAQEELDRVVGQSRLPTFEDRLSLPYITAISREVLRWFPVTPLALPHVTTEEDEYGGYRIPKGCVIIANAWNVLHDPKLYPEPSVFRPERFIPDKHGNVARDPGVNGAFGFGRRICAGRNLAEASIWIAVASLLAVYDIRPALDKDGKPVDVSHAFDGEAGLFNHPRPFKCRITPRSERAKQVILETVVSG